MKYSEFKRDVEAMGFKIGICGGYIDVLDEYDEPLLSVGTEYDFSICTDYSKFDELDKDNKKELFYLAVELASTPLEEREDEKRYRLRLPFAIESGGYLNNCYDKFLISSKTSTSDCKTVFTESEITELKQKYNLDSFVLEEVKEDE